jgi:hypothetical protein
MRCQTRKNYDKGERRSHNHDQNQYVLPKGRFRPPNGQLDTKEATGRIARSPKKLNGAREEGALGLLLGLKPFLGERERQTGDGLPIAETGGREFAGGDIASRMQPVYGLNHQRGQKYSCRI